MAITALKASVRQTFGKIIKGFTEVASVVLLKAVSTIQKKGTNMVMEINTRVRCTTKLLIFLFLSKLSIGTPFLIIVNPLLLPDHL